MADASLWLWLSIAATLVGVVAPDRWRRSPPWLARVLPWPILALQVLPLAVLTWAMVTVDTTYLLVWQAVTEEMPLRYRISGLWSDRAGPILLWAGIMAALTTVASLRRSFGEGAAMHTMRVRLSHASVGILLVIAAGLGPFARTNPAWVNLPSTGMNALLQTDLMVIHPPLVFLYYSICMAVTLHVLARILSPSEDALSGARSADPDLPRRLRHPARPAFLFGALSIGLGGLWAYLVLDWGGYWAWDPVETGSFLPWVALVLLLHNRVRPGRAGDGSWLLFGMLPGVLAVHATLITRASGVWASVHAFVTNAATTPPPTAWGRIMILRSDLEAGAEVTTYLVLMMALLGVLLGWWMWRLLDEGSEPDQVWRWVAMGTLGLAVLAALSGLLEPRELDGGGEAVSWWAVLQHVPGSVLALLAGVPVWTAMVTRRERLRQLVGREPLRVAPLVGALCLWVFIPLGDDHESVLGWAVDPVVAGVALVLSLSGLVSGRSPSWWQGAAVVLLVFAAWANIVHVGPAAIAMGLTLVPWLMAADSAAAEGAAAAVDGEETAVVEASPEATESMPDRLWRQLQEPAEQQRLALWAPLVVGGAFLLLTWLILLGSIDGARFGEHEALGAPFVLLGSLALATYAWKGRVTPRLLLGALLAATVIGLLLAVLWSSALPGDADEPLLGPIVRGHVGWLLLPLLLVALPAFVRLVWDRFAVGQRRWRLRRGEARERARRSARRSLGPQLAHLGILLLLLGHVMSSTLVERDGFTHAVSLSRDQPQEVGGVQLVYRELDTMNSSDPEFNQRFDVGDAFIGAAIDVLDEDGEFIETLEPGVLRFDGPVKPFPRSEVARLPRFTGDLILIFDSSQAQVLGGVMDDPSSVERIRVTVYDLPGSNLVWLGWGLLLLGMALTWSGQRWPLRTRAGPNLPEPGS